MADLGRKLFQLMRVEFGEQIEHVLKAAHEAQEIWAVIHRFGDRLQAIERRISALEIEDVQWRLRKTELAILKSKLADMEAFLSIKEGKEKVRGDRGGD